MTFCVILADMKRIVEEIPKLLSDKFPFFRSIIFRLGNLGFFLGKLEILIVALSKSTYQSQGSRVQLPVGA